MYLYLSPVPGIPSSSSPPFLLCMHSCASSFKFPCLHCRPLHFVFAHHTPPRILQQSVHICQHHLGWHKPHSCADQCMSPILHDGAWCDLRKHCAHKSFWSGNKQRWALHFQHCQSLCGVVSKYIIFLFSKYKGMHDIVCVNVLNYDTLGCQLGHETLRQSSEERLAGRVDGEHWGQCCACKQAHV
jgi:hypothetical protein